MCGDEVENKHSCTLNTLTSFRIRSNLASYVWHRPLVASFLMFSRRGGGRAGKKLQVCPCVTLQSCFCCHLLPFRSIHVGGICVTSRRLGCLVQVRHYSCSACLLRFMLPIQDIRHWSILENRIGLLLGLSDFFKHKLSAASPLQHTRMIMITVVLNGVGIWTWRHHRGFAANLANVLWRQGSPSISASILGEDNHGTMGCAPTISLGCLTLFFRIKYRQKLTSRMWKKKTSFEIR